jgi:glycine/D-amino acid oxidase-like deaminating enzyme
MEPRINNLPFHEEVLAVHRKADYTADCAVFIKDLTDKVTQEYGVEYRVGPQGMIDGISTAKGAIEQSSEPIGIKSKALATDPAANQQRFSLVTKDGRTHDFDFVVLAAGVNTPLFARMLSVGDSCPTYPLRGYSLTMYTDKSHSQETETGPSKNLLNRPIKVDDMYCSSVGANMARIAGFGELVGYRDKATNVPSLAPKVLARYGKKLFPESNINEANALQCFRPLSPDDIPIVGAVRSVPGVFLHSGHGTLGWTLCLATSECLAAAMTDEIVGRDHQKMYHLPGDISVERARLSPDRFL